MRALPTTIPASKRYAHRDSEVLWSLLYASVFGILFIRASLDTVLDIVQIPVGSGGQLTLGAGFNAALIGITLLLLLINKKPIDWKLQLPWLAFIGYCAFMSITTTDPVGVVRLLLVIISYQCVFMLPFLLIRTPLDARRFVNVVIYSSFIPAIIALDQIPYGNGTEDGRIAATFTHPNILAFYTLVVMAAIAFRLVSPLFKDTQAKRGWLIVYGGIMGIVLLATQTRSAWASATIFLLAYAIFVNRRALLALFALPVLVALSPSIQQRLLDAISPAEYIGTGVILNSYEWRQQLWRDAMSWIEQSPIVGHGGLGSFLKYSPEFFPLETNGVYAHNVYIQLAFETGVLGAVLFATIFLFIAWRFVRVFNIDRAASVIGAAFCIVYLALSYSDNMLYYLASNWYAFMFLGTLLVITARSPGRRTPSNGTARPRSLAMAGNGSRPGATTSGLATRRSYPKLRSRL
ncbi:hypothetical protein DLM45_15465 [Hyphomicrobium methylovorum]|uniref:O-antigen ligase family protein n=1 Tax=Hyphomicrobium methylovorum TaxID=84 RepID=UPI0015E6C329|nr:O-antigen ligase family protein [Hyphomicrobium methylovorum]MBA2127610.1 hypothetical protein [Hyphomicrobium methylovorum]